MTKFGKIPSANTMPRRFIQEVNPTQKTTAPQHLQNLLANVKFEAGEVLKNLRMMNPQHQQVV